MTILEETDSEYKSELKLWENTHGKIWIEVGYDENEPGGMQGIAITKEDAKALISELTRIIKELEPEVIQPKINKPEQLTLQKVNWNK